MKKSTSVLLSLVAVASIASSTVAQAQLSNPVKFTVFGGAALAERRREDDLKTGYTLGGAADLRAPLMPVGLRARAGLLEPRRKGHRRTREPPA